MNKTITLLAAVACFGGGLFTATGQGLPEAKESYLPPEVLEEAERIEREAKAGDAKSQSLLGFLYEEGKFGKIENYQKAFEWYMKSAKQGYPPACTVVSMLLIEGKGTEKNLVEARAWYLVAKSQHGPLAKSVSDDIETVWKLDLTTEDVTQSQARAEEIQKEIAANKKAKKDAEQKTNKDEKDDE